METKMHNLIIVDKSGSMGSVTRETIAGVNETIGGIQATARRTPEQKQFITLVAFCGCEQRYIFDNTPAEQARFITEADYQPCCSTPLYDTVGRSCICMERQVGDDKMAAVSVTILTDGYENSSKEFRRDTIVALIKRLKEKGWMFAYIGADHDVKSVAYELNIDNFMRFAKDEEGMKVMFRTENAARANYSETMHKELCCCRMAAVDEEEMLERKKKRSIDYFDGQNLD